MRETENRGRIWRLLGEFLVIFVGVLTALAADQWVQTQRDRELEASYLVRLESDLVSDSLMLAERLEASLEGLKRIDALWRGLPGEVVVELPELRPFDLFGSGVPPMASSSTFDELISTGNLTLIQDVSIRSVLLEYYQVSARRSGDLENAFRRGRDPLMELTWDAGANAPEGFRELGVGVERSRLQVAVMRAASFHEVLSRSIGQWQEYLAGVLSQVRGAQR